MAKQSGLNQIRGKVGEHSYYSQSGVSSGLIRKINQGMSQRVKTDEAFANTRLNNAEFGQGCRVASCLIQHITPKYRTMLLTFAQAKAAKKVVERIKDDATHNWGERTYYDTTGEITSQILNSLAKGNFSNLPISFGVRKSASADGELVIGESMDSYLQSLGCNGAEIRVFNCRPIIGDYFAGIWGPSVARKVVGADIDYIVGVTGGTENVSPTFPIETPSGTNSHNVSFVLVTVLPYKEINNIRHIMQEYCTYGVFTPDVYTPQA